MAVLDKLNEIKKAIQEKFEETKLDFALKKSESAKTTLSKTDEKEMMRLIDSYIAGTMKPEEMLIFINLTKRYFYQVKNLDAGIDLPKTIIETVTKKNVLTGETEPDTGIVAAYNHARNVFIINVSTLENCIKSIDGENKSVLMDVVNFTGHELTHYEQHLMNEVFEGLSPAEQKNFDKKTYEVIKDIEDGVDLQLDAKTLLEMDSFMGKYTKSMQDFGLSAEHFQVFQKVRYAKYSYERDARSGAIDFTKEFVKLIESSEFASERVKTWAKENQESIERFEQKEITIENEIISKEENKMLERYYQTIGRQVLAKLVNDNENKSFNFNQSMLYKRCVAEIVEHFTYEEKEEYLKIAIAKHLPQFANVIIKSIKRDPNYLEHNEDLKNMLTEGLAKGELAFDEGKTAKINPGGVNGECIDYSSLLTEDRLGYCVMQSLARNDYASAYKVSSLIKTNYFSKQHILEQSEIIEKNNFYGKEYAIKALIVNLSFDDIVSLLETAARNNMPTLKAEILSQLNKMPEFHLNRKDVLKKLSKASGETQFEADEEMILKGCAQFCNEYYFSSFLNNLNNKQEPEKEAAMQKIHALYKTVYKQEIKKGGKALESQVLSDSTIKEYLLGSEFGFQVAERIVDNKVAYLSLLKTLTEDHIMVNGQKFVIGEDDKRKLAELLEAILDQKEFNRKMEAIDRETAKIKPEE